MRIRRKRQCPSPVRKRPWPPAAVLCLLAAPTFAVFAGSSDLTEGTFELPLGREKVEFFYQVSRVVGQGPLVVSLHRNENTSFPLVREILREYPGRFVGIKTPGGRRLSLKGDSEAFTIDPNRIFSEAGILHDLKRFSFYTPEIAKEIGSFSEAYLKKLKMDRGTVVIAVHNNTDGGYSIDSYREGGSEAAAAAELFVNPQKDKDDFILVTNPAHFRPLKDLGFNVVLQNNANAPNDGSLSVHCGREGITYFNVESEFGHAQEQDRMLRAVFDLATGKNPSPGAKGGDAIHPDAPAATPVARPIESGAIRLSDPSPKSPGAAAETGDTPQPRPGLRAIEPKNP